MEHNLIPAMGKEPSAGQGLVLTSTTKPKPQETQHGAGRWWSGQARRCHPSPAQGLTGPQSETVHWRSQGGPVQFFSARGRALASHSFSSSEQRMSRVTTLRSPHRAEHWGQRGQREQGTHPTQHGPSTSHNTVWLKVMEAGS